VISREDAKSISKMIKNEDQFDLMFMEGLKESEVNIQDKMFSTNKKQDYYNTKQQISVGNRTFEFTKHDTIFKLS
jgi:O6-methylguanine-DNA--protein-cysteine methyltransferase